MTSLANGEARVYNALSGLRIMSVDVDGLPLDEAADVAFKAIAENVRPGVLCSLEIDQKPDAESVG